MLTAAFALAGLILQQSNQLRNDIRSLDARLRTVERVQVQHSIKLNQQGELLQRLADRDLGQQGETFVDLAQNIDYKSLTSIIPF